MKVINALLALFVSVLFFLLLFEGGLRLLGKAPKQSIHRFDPELGWSKEPGAKGRQKTGEFDVRFEINEQGLRDDPTESTAKADGTFRVLMLGDSFVLGYTVDREDLFVDQLESLWQAEGRRVDVVNAGTEGWSTDQEVRWFLSNGERFAPDLVLLFPYENDLYWNGQSHYGRFPKPRFTAGGEVEPGMLADPGQKPAWQNSAIGNLFARPSAAPQEPASWSPDGTATFAGPLLEWSVYFEQQPDFMVEAVARTGGALRALREECSRLGSALFIVPIPGKASVDAAARTRLEGAVGVDPALWSPDKPVDTFLSLAKDLNIESIDVRSELRRHRSEGGGPLYFDRDWHFNPDGNRVFARTIDDALGKAGAFPGTHFATEAATIPEGHPKSSGLPVRLFLILWGLLGVGFVNTYRDENPVLAFFKVGALLTVIFAIALGGSWLIGVLPPPAANALLLLFVAVLLGFILYKLGRRLGTISELLKAFVLRGHWYLMPLVVVLLTIGSLLVVAASSPLVAPFIYTLF